MIFLYLIILYLVFSWAFGLMIISNKDSFSLKENLFFIFCISPVIFGIFCLFVAGFSLVWVLLLVLHKKEQNS